MKRTAIALGAVTAMTASSGCAGFAFGGHKTSLGAIYNSSRTNEMVTQNALGSKMGEACAKSILGWVTLGDASVEKAAKDGGITTVSSVDHNFKNYVGVYSIYCVQVSGE